MYTLAAALLCTVLLGGLRLDLARSVGLSDAEALFVAYGFHPQAAYVDYPGLIGWFSRALAPEPWAVHVATTGAATALPWLGVLAARAGGATRDQALRVYFPLALLPALSIGSFAFSPDLLLCYFWLCALGCAGLALRRPATSFVGLLAAVFAGVSTALACLSKPSGWLLALALVLCCLGRVERQRFRTIAPWAALGMFAILVTPLVTYGWSHGVSLRLDPELSPQHAALVLFRPLLSATPPFLIAGGLAARDLYERSRQGSVERALWLQLLVPLAPMAALAIASSAETDWLTPAYLVLSLAAARLPPLRRSLTAACLVVGLGVALLGWCWLRTSLPVVTGQWLGGYDATLDASNDYFAWSSGKQLLEDAVAAARERTGQTPIIVGPHWSVCAQAEVALGGQVHVGCDTVERDDYDDWSDPSLWSRAQTLLFVTDSRFHPVPPESFYGREAVSVHRAAVERFGQVVRELSVSEFDLDEGTASEPRARDAVTSAR